MNGGSPSGGLRDGGLLFFVHSESMTAMGGKRTFAAAAKQLPSSTGPDFRPSGSRFIGKTLPFFQIEQLPQPLPEWFPKTLPSFIALEYAQRAKMAPRIAPERVQRECDLSGVQTVPRACPVSIAPNASSPKQESQMDR